MLRGYYASARQLWRFSPAVKDRGVPRAAEPERLENGPARRTGGRVKNRDHPFRYRMSVISIVRIPEATWTDYSYAGPVSARRIRLRALASVNGSRGFAARRRNDFHLAATSWPTGQGEWPRRGGSGDACRTTRHHTTRRRQTYPRGQTCDHAPRHE